MTLIICGFVLIGYGTWYVLDYVLAKEDLESVAKERDRLHEDLERAKKLHENLEVEITKSYANEVNELAKKSRRKRTCYGTNSTLCYDYRCIQQINRKAERVCNFQY